MSDRDTEPPKVTPAADDEVGFLGRWSRRKQAVARGETPAEPASPVPVEANEEPRLPDPLTLGMDDDFSGFLRDTVPAALKRKAMQHLFSHAQFNQVDGLDVYMEDFNQVAGLDAASMDLVQHAKAVLNPEPAQNPEAPSVADTEMADDESAESAGPASLAQSDDDGLDVSGTNA